jgi:hypothetical protein
MRTFLQKGMDCMKNFIYEMKVIKQFFHGGDVQGYQIDKLPAGAKKITDPKRKIIARGETSGHCHILTGDVELYELGGQAFAVVGKDGAYHQHYKEANVKEEIFKINRNISDCDHTKDCRIIEPGTYAIGIDRQYDPHEGGWKINTD